MLAVALCIWSQEVMKVNKTSKHANQKYQFFLKFLFMVPVMLVLKNVKLLINWLVSITSPKLHGLSRNVCSCRKVILRIYTKHLCMQVASVMSTFNTCIDVLV